ncbi:MAG TPA: L-threonylcarbamoyladenylate synthase [Chitinophagaceae bacterium]|nr:L-threonylcarbamoyladenylate synthase [Chitinophagaceae bacterium]
MPNNFDNDIKKGIETLEAGGTILYPTDTIWGIGCDALNEAAVKKIYDLKKRPDQKSMIILVAGDKDISNYVEYPDERIFEYLKKSGKPTTVIYENAKNLAHNLISSDGTIAIRIVKDEFCRQLITEFKKPIVSTSANISGEAFPANFNDIDPVIKKGVDHIVQHRQNDIMVSQPSSIIKLNKEGNIDMLR